MNINNTPDLTEQGITDDEAEVEDEQLNDTDHMSSASLQVIEGGQNERPEGQPSKPVFIGPYNRNLLERQLKAVGAEFRYNIRTRCREMRQLNKDTNEWTEWATATLSMEDRIFQDIADETLYKKNKDTDKFSRPDWKGASRHGIREQVMRALLEEKMVDSWQEHLEGLPEWNGVPLLDDCIRLSGLQVADDTPDSYLRYASKITFLAAVARAYDPGVKYDNIVILTGKTRAGKSTFWAHSIPEKLRSECFGDSLNLHGDEQKMLEACLGKVLIECSELKVAINKLETVKAFASRQDDNAIRLPYQERTEPRPRRFVIVGTSNEMESLPDDKTGLRRFWPVKIT